MSFVQSRFPLPSVTGRNGAVLPISFAPGRCAVDVKSGITTKQSRVIRPIVQRAKLSIVPANRSLGELAGFWDSLTKAITGAAKGFAVGGPAGAVAGGAGGAIDGSVGNGKGKGQPAQPQQQLGPLAGVNTGTIVGVGLGFTALILVLASGLGRGR